MQVKRCAAREDTNACAQRGVAHGVGALGVSAPVSCGIGRAFERITCTRGFTHKVFTTQVESELALAALRVADGAGNTARSGGNVIGGVQPRRVDGPYRYDCHRCVGLG